MTSKSRINHLFYLHKSTDAFRQDLPDEWDVMDQAGTQYLLVLIGGGARNVLMIH